MHPELLPKRPCSAPAFLPRKHPLAKCRTAKSRKKKDHTSAFRIPAVQSGQQQKGGLFHDTNTRFDSPPGGHPITPLRVLDVSRWQGCIDWDAVQRSGAIDGVMLRVLGSRNGQPYPDPQFERNHAACTARGIPVGGYYYTCAVTSRQTEAELNALRAALRGKTFQLPLAIDVENARLRSLSPAALAQRVAQAAAQLEAWSLYAMVYTYTNFADTALAMDALTAYDLWLADYRGKRPTRPHGMWQYTSTGHVAGIDGPVDLSRAYKDYPALCRRAGLGRFSG